jgi:hypothetical protein
MAVRLALDSRFRGNERQSPNLILRCPRSGPRRRDVARDFSFPRGTSGSVHEEVGRRCWGRRGMWAVGQAPEAAADPSRLAPLAPQDEVGVCGGRPPSRYAPLARLYEAYRPAHPREGGDERGGSQWQCAWLWIPAEVYPRAGRWPDPGTGMDGTVTISNRLRAPCRNFPWRCFLDKRYGERACRETYKAAPSLVLHRRQADGLWRSSPWQLLHSP